MSVASNELFQSPTRVEIAFERNERVQQEICLITFNLVRNVYGHVSINE